MLIYREGYKVKRANGLHYTLGLQRIPEARQTDTRVVYIQTLWNENVYNSVLNIFELRQGSACMGAVCAFVCIHVCVLPSVTVADEMLSEMYCTSWTDGHIFPIVQGRKLRQRLSVEPQVASLLHRLLLPCNMTLTLKA